MKNNTQNTNNSINNNDGFGLGIQVFKIQSKKSTDQLINKGKSRNIIKNIQNPNQTYSFKPPLIPKPKVLPSLQKSTNNLHQKSTNYIYQKSNHNFHQKQQSSLLNNNNKNNGSLMSDYSDKIYQRKGLIIQGQKSKTPNSKSINKRIISSYQKPHITKSQSNTIRQKSTQINHNINNNNNNNNNNNKTQKSININNNNNNNNKTQKSTEINRNNNNKTSILTQIKQKTTRVINIKVKQVPSQICKLQQQQFIDYHSNHINFTLAQRQNQKQIRQLKKIKQNQQNEQIFDHIQYIQSLNGIIDTVIDNQDKQLFQIKHHKNQQNKNKKKHKQINNIIVPITGFQMNSYQMFDHYQIQNYSMNSNMTGQFKIHNYQNIDLAPIHIQEDQKQEKNYTKKIN